MLESIDTRKDSSVGPFEVTTESGAVYSVTVPGKSLDGTVEISGGSFNLPRELRLIDGGIIKVGKQMYIHEPGQLHTNPLAITSPVVSIVRID